MAAKHLLAAMMLVAATAAPARAALEWRGQDLSEMGIRKGSGLPIFFLYIDGMHSSFAAQGVSQTPPWTVLWGFYNQFYYSDSLRDDEGREVDTRFHSSTYSLVQRMVLTTPLRTEHAQLYVEAIPIFVSTDFRVGSAAASTTGLGDFGVGAGLLLPDVYKTDWLEVDGLVGLDVFLPTGHYRAGGLHNLSSNYYSYLAQIDLIFQLRKIGNGVYFSPAFYFAGASENDDFLNPATGERGCYQQGPDYQQIFKLLYHVDKVWSAGFEGFFDLQVRDDRMDGSRVKNSSERSLMLGPIVTGAFGRVLLDASVLREFDVANRPQGTRFTAIVYLVF